MVLKFNIRYRVINARYFYDITSLDYLIHNIENLNLGVFNMNKAIMLEIPAPKKFIPLLCSRGLMTLNSTKTKYDGFRDIFDDGTLGIKMNCSTALAEIDESVYYNDSGSRIFLFEGETEYIVDSRGNFKLNEDDVKYVCDTFRYALKKGDYNISSRGKDAKAQKAIKYMSGWNGRPIKSYYHLLFDVAGVGVAGSDGSRRTPQDLEKYYYRSMLGRADRQNAGMVLHEFRNIHIPDLLPPKYGSEYDLYLKFIVPDMDHSDYQTTVVSFHRNIDNE